MHSSACCRRMESGAGEPPRALSPQPGPQDTHRLGHLNLAMFSVTSKMWWGPGCGDSWLTSQNSGAAEAGGLLRVPDQPGVHMQTPSLINQTEKSRKCGNLYMVGPIWDMSTAWEGGAEPAGPRLGGTGAIQCLQAHSTLTHSAAHSYIHSCTLIHLHTFIIHSHTQSLTHSFTHTLSHSHTHSHASEPQLSLSFLSWSQCLLRSLGTSRERPDILRPTSSLMQEPAIGQDQQGTAERGWNWVTPAVQVRRLGTPAVGCWPRGRRPSFKCPNLYKRQTLCPRCNSALGS